MSIKKQNESEENGTDNYSHPGRDHGVLKAEKISSSENSSGRMSLASLSPKANVSKRSQTRIMAPNDITNVAADDGI